MKKILKFLLIGLVLIFALLLIIPFAFKGKILEIAKNEVNRNLNARVEFADLRLSLIRNFPNLSVSMIDMSVVGVGDFENDTLVSFKVLRTVVDLKSVIWGDAIEVRSIFLDTPNVKARVLADGHVNWDIMIKEEGVEDPDTEVEDPESAVEDPDPAVEDPDFVAAPESETAAFRVSLQRFEIRNGRFEYDDAPFEVRTTFEELNGVMRGDLTQDITSLDISLSSDIFNFWYAGIRYISNASLAVNTLMDADLNDFRFTFMENEMMLNELSMGVEGFFAMPGSDIDIDLKFFSKETSFRTMLSLIPAIFMSDFEDLTAWGSIQLEGFVRGAWSDGAMPSAGLDLYVSDAGFSYPDLPKSLENMNMSLNLYYDGVFEDRTTFDLHSFHMEMAGNPFDMRLSMRTPISGMHVDASFAGTIDFTGIEDVIPLEGVTIRGLLESDFYFSGYIPDLENGRYEDFNAGGRMSLTAFRYSDQGFPLGVSIPGAILDFSPRYVELSDFDMQLGRSDIRMSGRMENFIPYLFNDGTVAGTMMFSSTMLDLNELIALSPEEADADTVPLSIVKVPDNIDFTLASSIDDLLFNNMEIRQLRGRVLVRDKMVLLEGVTMNMLGGSIDMSGEYNTKDMDAPFFDFSIDIRDFDIPSSFHTFNTVQKLTPLAGDLRGSYSAMISMNALLDEEMMPVMNSIDATGRLRTSAVEVISSTTFDRLSGALRLREDRDNVLRDLNIGFKISDGRVYLDPFDARLGPVMMVIGGDQGIDGTMNYVMKMTIPRSEFGSGAEQVIDDLAAGAAARGLNIQPGENVNVDARITGTFSEPQISLNIRESARATIDQVRDQIRTQAVEEVERRVEQVEERVREEASERADQILREAEQRAEQIRQAAADAAEKIRKEGKAAASKLEQEASGRGRIAETAAKRSADGIRREADQKANALVREADEKAEKILEDAGREADRLR